MKDSIGDTAGPPAGSELTVAASELDVVAKGLEQYRIVVRHTAAGRYLEAVRHIHQDLSPSLVEAMRRAIATIEQAGLETEVKTAASRARLTYQRDLERSLVDVGVRYVGPWPTYIVEDVLGLDVDLPHWAVRVGGRRIASIEPRDVASEVRTHVRRLLDRPFEREAFLGALWDAYKGLVTVPASAAGGYVDIRQVYRALKIAMAKEGRDRQYSETKFSIDLYKLLRDGTPVHNGHKLQVTPAQSAGRGLHVPGSDGGNFIAALRFVEDDLGK